MIAQFIKILYKLTANNNNNNKYANNKIATKHNPTEMLLKYSVLWSSESKW